MTAPLPKMSWPIKTCTYQTPLQRRLDLQQVLHDAKVEASHLLQRTGGRVRRAYVEKLNDDEAQLVVRLEGQAPLGVVVARVEV